MAERVGVKTLFIEPGSPWGNGYCESFNGKLQDELLKCEIFFSLAEAKVLIEQWRREGNTIAPTALAAIARLHRRRSALRPGSSTGQRVRPRARRTEVHATLP